MAGRSGAERGRIARLAAERGLTEENYISYMLGQYGSKERAAQEMGVSRSALDYWLRQNRLTVEYRPVLVDVDKVRAVMRKSPGSGEVEDS